MKWRKTSRPAATIAVFLLSSFAAADDLKPASGVYDGLLLAVDPASGAISGYLPPVPPEDWIDPTTGKAPLVICSFSFAGAAGEQKIVAWWPGGGPIVDSGPTVGGAISFKGDSLTLSLQGQPGGCQNFMPDDNTLDLDLTARHAWRAVRVIRSARAYFYDAPDEKTRRKAFAVEDDGVGVLRSEQNWAEVEFVGDARTTRGWMKTGDFYAGAPLKSRGPVPAAGNAASGSALKAFLRAYAAKQDPEPDRKTRYLAVDARLREGGQGQILVYLMGDEWCGAGGCDLLVLDRVGQTYRLITEVSLVRPPVRVLASRHNGWRDIGVWVAGGGIMRAYEAPLTFDGRTYPGNPTLVHPRSARQRGREVLSGDETGSPLFP